MGGALLQLDKEGKARFIAFTSKRLSPAQVKSGVTSKEACALVHCLIGIPPPFLIFVYVLVRVGLARARFRTRATAAC